MKLTVCVLVMLGAIVMVRSEECRSTGDCNHVSCPENDYVLECHNRQCTCTKTSGSGCSAPSDCSDDRCDRTWHCIDGRCRCGFGFGGIGK